MMIVLVGSRRHIFRDRRSRYALLGTGPEFVYSIHDVVRTIIVPTTYVDPIGWRRQQGERIRR